MATAKKPAAPKKFETPKPRRAVRTAADGAEILVSIIPIARSGRPDFELVTTYLITSELTRSIAEHARKVEADFAASMLKPKQLRPFYER